MNAAALMEELLRRRDADQSARAAIPFGGRAAFERAMAIDDDNAEWLKGVIETVGWPGRSMVGEDGAHAAWLLAQHADRRPGLQRRCLELLRAAVADGEGSAADLAYLTDRVLLASGEAQIYGTQFAGLNGEYVPCRLQDADTVDQRRGAAGLGTLQEMLDRALELYGPPTPGHVVCAKCGRDIEVWLTGMGGTTSVECQGCGNTLRLRPVVAEVHASTR